MRRCKGAVIEDNVANRAYTFTTNVEVPIGVGAMPLSYRLLISSVLIAALSACGTAGGGTPLQPSALPALRATTAFQVLYNFQGGPTDAAGPNAVVEGPAGTMLGTSSAGGHIHPRDCKMTGCGTIFEFNGSTERPIYLFQPQPSGYSPAGLLLHNGVYYGVAAGGVHNMGAVYSLSQNGSGNWVVTTLYSFKGAPADGSEPNGLFYIGAGGAIFGTTRMGGSGTSCLFTSTGCGTVFELQPPAQTGGPWTESLLHSFQGSPDGAGPDSSVVRKAGSFYGTTEFGGASKLCPAVLGCGTIYKLTVSGSTATEQVVHSFYVDRSSADGVWGGALTDGGDGKLYGTTRFGGGSQGCEVEPEVHGCGTFFSFTLGRGKKSQLTTRYAFAGGQDGELPGVLSGTASSGFYGATAYGGSPACFDGCGTIFHMTPSGGEQLLHVFSGSDGRTPNGPLLSIGSKLYGTAEAGGTAACSCGTLFELQQQ